jgi:segregation and condensation protein B
MSEREEMEAALESILFVAHEPVPRVRLLALFDADEQELAAEALTAVIERYRYEPFRGVMAEEVAGGVRLVTRPEMVGWLRKFFAVGSGNKLSMAALETLAIIAYRQPITGPEIQELRTVNPSGVLKTLLEKRLVRIAGRKEVVGKPFLYATTREFLVHFGLNRIGDLPPLEEFEETFGAVAASLAASEAAANEPQADSDEQFAREAEELEAAAERSLEDGQESETQHSLGLEPEDRRPADEEDEEDDENDESDDEESEHHPSDAVTGDPER